jgi:hypothetical protein
MKKLIVTISILIPLLGSAQTKQPVYYYDSLGNEYRYDPAGVPNSYDHLPTSQDSLQSGIGSQKEMPKKITSVKRVPTPKPAKKTYPRKNK